MTILTKKDIEDRINLGKLISNGNLNRVSTCSYDMAVGTIFKDGLVIDSTLPPAERHIIVKPGEVVTMLTSEELHLPKDIAATAYAMNSRSSEGFLVLNPGHVDPGFNGPLEIKAINLRKVSLVLCLEDPIFTVIFQKLEMTEGYKNHCLILEDRKREVRKKELELTVRSISDLVALNGPFPTEEGVKKLIFTHWMTWLMFLLTVAAAFGGVVAAIPVLKGESSNPEKPVVVIQNPNACTDMQNPVEKSKHKGLASDHQVNKGNLGK
jgi:deoxycytidine triphosphate deaminase